MSRWFRLHDELVDDPKVQCLPDALFRALINLWCITSQNDGQLPPVDAMAFKLRLKPVRVAAIITSLTEAGLIVEDEAGTHPHNWNGRQYKSDVTDPTAPQRMQRYRNKRKAVTPNTVTHTVTVTPNRAETEQNTEPEAEQNSSQLPSPVDSKVLSIGEVKREASPPKHCAQNREKTRVYIEKGTPEWEAYAADYRATTGKEPNVNSNGGKWFKTQGQASSDGLDIPSYLRRA